METQESSNKQESRALRRLALYALGVVLVSAILLTINTGMVFSLNKGITGKLPDFPGVPQLSQLSLFVLPIVLLYAEWYAWDILTTRRGRRS